MNRGPNLEICFETFCDFEVTTCGKSLLKITLQGSFVLQKRIDEFCVYFNSLSTPFFLYKCFRHKMDEISNAASRKVICLSLAKEFRIPPFFISRRIFLHLLSYFAPRWQHFIGLHQKCIGLYLLRYFLLILSET